MILLFTVNVYAGERIPIDLVKPEKEKVFSTSFNDKGDVDAMWTKEIYENTHVIIRIYDLARIDSDDIFSLDHKWKLGATLIKKF